VDVRLLHLNKPVSQSVSQSQSTEEAGCCIHAFYCYRNSLPWMTLKLPPHCPNFYLLDVTSSTKLKLIRGVYSFINAQDNFVL